MNPLTQEENDLFQAIILGNISNPCLIRSEIDGIEVACIATAIKQENGEIIISPLAILANEKLFKKLKDPREDG